MRTSEWQHLEGHTTTLSVVVTLIDSITERMPADPPSVRLRDRPEPVTENRSGHFVLTDLPDAAAPFTIAIDGDDRYLPEELTIEEDAYDPPMEECVPLLPAPNYRFSPGATLVRGTVSAEAASGESVPIPAAELHLVGMDEDADVCSEEPPVGLRGVGRTDQRGEYVLCLRGITGDDVVEEYTDEDDDAPPIGTPVIHVDDAKPEIRATRPDTGAEETMAVGIAEGETAKLDFTF